MTGGLFAVIPPGLLLVVTGLLLPLVRGPVRAAVLLLTPLVVLAWLWAIPGLGGGTLSWLGLTLEPVRDEPLGRLFATVFAIMAFAGNLYALRQEKTVELAAAQVYAGSAIGVAMAGDLLTVFVFWEAMAIGSTLVVWAGGPGARKAGLRYAIIHFLGGVLLMAGIAGHVSATGSTAFAAMAADSPAHWLMLAGFLVNAGAPPLSAWIPDAYPRASWSGSVFLSAFTTKTAVYVLMRGFPGEELLIWLGLAMIVYGIVYAILDNDIRRILAYSIVSQVGFMVTAIGIGTEMTLNGAAAHAFVHIIYKALLLMAAGAVLYQTGRHKLTDLGGLHRSMPLTTVAYAIGALSIAAFPLTSGFVSKSMITDGAAHEHLAAVWFVLTAASAGTFLYAGMRLPWFAFFDGERGLRPTDPPGNMRAAMVLLSALCLLLGIFPAALYAMLPYPVHFEPYTAEHVAMQLQLLLAAGLAFFLLLPLLRPSPRVTLDIDWFWRRFPLVVAPLVRGLASLWREAAGRAGAGLSRLSQLIYRHHGPSGILARTWPTGSMAFWATLLLAAYLLVYYI